MKKIAFLVVIASLILAGTAGCSLVTFGTQVRGSGNVVQEIRTIEGIQRVELGTIGEMTIVIGETESLVIEAEDNLIEYFESNVSGDELTINSRPNTSIFTMKPVRYILTVKSLEGISVTSSGSISAPELSADDFELNSSSSGDIEVAGISATSVEIQVSSSGTIDIGELNADNLRVTISSSGDVSIDNGSVKIQEIDISSSGNYKAGQLASLKTILNLSSSGNATVRVSEHLTADLSSSGDVYYYGDPRVNVSTSSSGRVNKAGD